MPVNSLKKLLFVGCTHGDEQIGKFVFDTFPYCENAFFEWKSLIANPKAMYLNQRFVDQDLNRSFPGKAGGNYEENRARELGKVFPEYDLVIDFHQTFAEMSDVFLWLKKLKTILI